MTNKVLNCQNDRATIGEDVVVINSQNLETEIGSC